MKTSISPLKQLRRLYGERLPSQLELRHMVRVLAAVGLAALAAQALRLPQAQWAAISALVVAQGTLGGTLRAGRDRIGATVFGALAGVGAALAYAHGAPAVPVLCGALLAPVLLACGRREFSTAPVATIIVLSSSMASASPMGVALLRIAEIGLGAACAMLVTRFLLPTPAFSRIAHQGHVLLATLAGHLDQADGAIPADGLLDEAALARLRRCLFEIGMTARDAHGDERALTLARLLRRTNDDVMLQLRVRQQLRSHDGGQLVVLDDVRAVQARALHAAGRALLAPAPVGAGEVAALQAASRQLRQGQPASPYAGELGATARFAIKSLASQLAGIERLGQVAP